MVGCGFGCHAHEGVVHNVGTQVYINYFREYELRSREVFRGSHHQFTVLIVFQYAKSKYGCRDRVFAYFLVLLIIKSNHGSIAYAEVEHGRAVILESYFCSGRECFLAVRGFCVNSDRN